MKNNKRFKNLSIGQKFIFAGEKIYPSMEKGPWVKTSSRTYKHAETNIQHTVGSINTEVIEKN